MTQEIDIAALRKAAQEAINQLGWAAQPMQYDKGVVGWDDDWIVHEIGAGCIAYSMDKKDAQYVAAANPAVILALLDRLEQAEKDAARYQHLRRHAIGYPFIGLYGSELDAEVDAAMQGEGA